MSPSLQIQTLSVNHAMCSQQSLRLTLILKYNCSYEAGVYYQWSDTENDEQIWTWSGLIVMEIVWLNWRWICTSLRRNLRPENHPNLPRLQLQTLLLNGRKLNGTTHWGIQEIQSADNNVKSKKHKGKQCFMKRPEHCEHNLHIRTRKMDTH